MNIGRIVVIEGVPTLGKNRVKEHGWLWRVVDAKPGDNFLLMSEKDKYLKWGLRPDFKLAEDQLRRIEEC